MGVVIGMDEAGYGPNLGPLVVTTTVWEVPGHPRDHDLWTEFAGLVDSSAARNGEHIQIADSKVVHNSAAGVGALEVGVLSALALGGVRPASLRELWKRLACVPVCDEDGEPWFDDPDLPLPHAACPVQIGTWADRWRARCDDCGIRLREVRSDIVLTRRFNRLTQQYGSKGVALSTLSLQLLQRVWNPDTSGPTLIIADKHGGRNRYDALLSPCAGDNFIFRVQEGAECSHYRVGETDIRFQTRAESHLPVALASMVSKYLREVTMILFNRFWQAHVPDLRPTKGYPTDAWRFKEAIAAAQERLQIPDEVVWRAR